MKEIFRGTKMLVTALIMASYLVVGVGIFFAGYYHGKAVMAEQLTELMRGARVPGNYKK